MWGKAHPRNTLNSFRIQSILQENVVSMNRWEKMFGLSWTELEVKPAVEGGKLVHQMSNSLVFKSVSKSHAGRYRCRIDSKKVAEFEIRVCSPLSVTFYIGETGKQLRLESTVELTCNVAASEGQGTPSIVWFKDANPISTSGRLRLLSPNVIQVSKTSVCI